MHRKIAENICSAKDFALPLSECTKSKNFILKEMEKKFVYKDGKKTDSIGKISYKIVDETTFDTFKVNVNTTVPIISQQEIEDAKDFVRVIIPTEETLVTPYSCEYGKMRVTITAPWIKLAQDSGGFTSEDFLTE